jgi:hypothetical protein
VTARLESMTDIGVSVEIQGAAENTVFPLPKGLSATT